MNRLIRASTLLLVLWWSASLAAAQSRVIVKANRTNVRAKPSLDAEVLASLNQGQEVVVLGEVLPDGSKEPWTRIALPKSVAVWVHRPLVNRSAGTVQARELNFRTGPGLNYSVLGKLKRGDSVTVIQASGDWLQIEPPADAVAYIASRLLGGEIPPPSPTFATPSPVRPVPPLQAPPPASPSSSVATLPTTTQVTRSPEPVSAPVVETPPPPAPVITSVTPTEPSPSFTSPSPTLFEMTPPRDETDLFLNLSLAEPPRRPPLGSPRDLSSRPITPGPNVLLGTRLDDSDYPFDESIPARFVVREGYVRLTTSPQAPTRFELRRGFYNEGAINFLLFDTLIDQRHFASKRVMVSGHEYLDKRWRLPVLKVDNIQILP